MLTFYADAVAESPLRGAKVLLDLLQAESHWRVIRSGAREEPFKRHKGYRQNNLIIIKPLAA